MRHNKTTRALIFYTYNSATDKTTITDGTTTEIFTGYNLGLFVKMFKRLANITSPANLIRY